MFRSSEKMKKILGNIHIALIAMYRVEKRNITKEILRKVNSSKGDGRSVTHQRLIK